MKYYYTHVYGSACEYKGLLIPKEVYRVTSTWSTYGVEK